MSRGNVAHGNGMGFRRYWSKTFRHAVRNTALFGTGKVLFSFAITILVRLADWYSRKTPAMTWSEFWRTLFVIVSAYIFVLGVSFVWNLIRAPALLDKEAAARVNQLEAEIKALRASLETDESHAAHLEDLRKQVLEPMLDYLNRQMLPVLDRQCGNVILVRAVLPRTSGGFMGEPTEFTETFGLGTAVEPPIDPVTYAETQWLTPIRDGALYSDARDNHYQSLIRSWDGLSTKFDGYNQACLDYTAHLRSEILKGTSLPEHDLGRTQSQWVWAIALAIIIFYRHLGLQRLQLKAQTNSSPCFLLDDGSHYFAQGSPDDITRCVRTLEALYEKKERIAELDEYAHVVKSEALVLMGQIESLLVTRRLHGKCPFVS